MLPVVVGVLGAGVVPVVVGVLGAGVVCSGELDSFSLMVSSMAGREPVSGVERLSFRFRFAFL